jgi:hypothetical protein
LKSSASVRHPKKNILFSPPSCSYYNSDSNRLQEWYKYIERISRMINLAGDDVTTSQALTEATNRSKSLVLEKVRQGVFRVSSQQDGHYLTRRGDQ